MDSENLIIVNVDDVVESRETPVKMELHMGDLSKILDNQKPVFGFYVDVQISESWINLVEDQGDRFINVLFGGSTLSEPSVICIGNGLYRYYTAFSEAKGFYDADHNFCVDEKDFKLMDFFACKSFDKECFITTDVITSALLKYYDWNNVSLGHINDATKYGKGVLNKVDRDLLINRFLDELSKLTKTSEFVTVKVKWGVDLEVETTFDVLGYARSSGLDMETFIEKIVEKEVVVNNFCIFDLNCDSLNRKTVHCRDYNTLREIKMIVDSEFENADSVLEKIVEKINM